MTTTTGLRLLLFGLPGSGKSSLLGALMQAAELQAIVLRGKLADDTGALAAVRETTYHGGPPAATAEVVAYPIHFRPAGAGAVAATLLDSDGRLAQEYLSAKRPLAARDSVLASTMLQADTVILTLDASAGSALEPSLAAFRDFLTLLQDTRSRRSDVADLPVYLVLTKCDQLAKADDTFLKWMQRIEDAKRKLGGRFAAFVGAGAPRPAFGAVDLNLWATAIRRPALVDRPPAAEPYGVAELFRQCLASALAFDRRAHRAGRRLEWAVGGLGLLVVLMMLVSALFIAAQPDNELTRLEDRVAAVLPEPNAKDAKIRLRGDLADRVRELAAIEQDPAFDRLPAKTRTAIHDTAAEITTYVQTKAAYRDLIKHPYQAKNEAEFNTFEQQARDFALPAAYAAAWADTSLEQNLERIRREYAAVRSAIGEELKWIGAQSDEGRRLNTEGNRIPGELAELDPAKQKEGRRHAELWTAEYLRYSNRSSFRMAADRLLPGTGSFPYADLRKFAAIRKARADWDEVKDRLDKTYKYVATFSTK